MHITHLQLISKHLKGRSGLSVLVVSIHFSIKGKMTLFRPPIETKENNEKCICKKEPVGSKTSLGERSDTLIHLSENMWKQTQFWVIWPYNVLHGLFYGLTSALNVASSPLFPPPIMWYGNLCYKALLTLQHYWFFYLDSMDIEFLGIEKHLLTLYLYNCLFA